MKYCIFIICFCVCASSAFAFEEQPLYTEDTYSIDTIYDQISNYTQTPQGGASWNIFSKTNEHLQTIRKDGEDWEYMKPEFSDDLKKLDNQKIRISGYIFPLNETEKHKHFIFGPFPLTCPYHYHTPLSLTLEVHADQPIAFSYDPIIIEGTLELVPEDIEHNVFYRLKDAILIE